jgi:penicillin-binding protein 2
MYDKRIKIFVVISVFLLLVCLLRLAQMQLFPDSSLQIDIAELKKGISRQLKTVRGKILDRNGRAIATDEPKFWLHINYELTSIMDERVQHPAPTLEIKDPARREFSLDEGAVSSSLARNSKVDAGDDLQQVIDKCTYFGLERADIEAKISDINNQVWNLRRYLAWKRNFPDKDFEQAVPDANERLMLIAKIDIAEMHKSFPLLQLKTDDDIFTAQMEFMDTEAVEILPMNQRFYPYGSVAAQTIGWVGPATQKQDKELFEDDRLTSYLEDEVCGREDGVEYACETILRGRRGEEVYDIDRKLISQTETQFGEDVQLTIDIELQKKIENYLMDGATNPNSNAPTAAVVIDVATGDILALISLPVFDLNRVRFDYAHLTNDPKKPLLNRAVNKQYPPGSVVKPLILIAGLESGAITADEIISCPAQKAPAGWPSCWIFNKYPWTGHDDMGQNNARNAVKGSCNIYFSHLADRIDPLVLQQWLFKFGYGHCVRLASFVERDVPAESRAAGNESRELRQAQGIISSTSQEGEILRFEQVQPLEKSERRFFGIGQGSLRVTPIQVANAMATIARGGLYKKAQLFLVNRPSSVVHPPSTDESRVTPALSEVEGRDEGRDLGISPQTLQVVYDGMNAVVNEQGGTAYREFAHSSFAGQDVSVYGKTGSTEQPDHAWFAGFAKDSKGRSISIAIIVEGGQHGSADAAPLARDIIQFCIDAGYIGNLSPKTQ